MTLSVRGVSPDTCKSLKIELQNQYNLGNNQYPEMLTAATKVLQNYVGSKRAAAKYKLVFDNGEKDRLSFLQSKPKLVCTTDRNIHSNIVYYHCEKRGHYKSHYSTIKEEEEEYKDTLVLHISDDTYLTDKSDTTIEEHDVSLLQAFCLISKFKGQIP